MTRINQLAAAAVAVLTGMVLNAAFAQTRLPSFTQNRATFSHKLDQQIQAMDSNHDGRISKTEYDHYWKRQFTQADTNHDGKLGRAEAHVNARRLNDGSLPSVRLFDQRWAEVSRQGSITETRDLAWHNHLFKRADTNRDGYLSRTEMNRAMSANNGNVSSL